MSNKDKAELILLAVIFILCMLSISTFAGDKDWVNKPSRVIVGGDLLHWGAGVSDKQEIALFKAESMALRSAVLECGFPHKDMKVWERQVDFINNQYKAYVRGGISIHECERMKRVKNKEKKRLTNNKLKKSLLLYDNYLKAELLPKPDTKELDKQIITDIKGDINNLQSKVEKLEARPAGKTTVHQTVQVQEIKVYGDAAKQQECFLDYRSLMDDANAEAMETSEPAGNLANGPANRIYNKAQRKLRQCSEMRR